MFSPALVTVLALSSSAFGAIFVTSPVASSSFTGGQSATISWEDDGTTPTLASFGASIVSVYVGNSLQQTSLQTIVSSVDVSTTQAITFTPDASIGPDSSEYFIRFESLALKDAASPQYPALAFSAKFALSGMSGTFNTTVQSEIDGQSTAPIAGSSSTAAASASTTAASATTTSHASSASASASKSSASASASAGSDAANGAAGMTTSGAKALVGVVALLAVALY